MPPSTTTTVAKPAAAMVPVSATFVSAQRGWVLEADDSRCYPGGACRFRVFGTADGGTTWRALGEFGDGQAVPTLRFADAMHGFAFDSTQVFASSDGGASWRRLTVPFSGVQSLEIAQGVVSVVGFSTTTINDFHVWSTTADRLNVSDWSMDPLGLPLGAGPVPVEQLTFAGSAGYLLNSDRTVIGGARLSSAHRWVTWTPPCLTGGGAENLSASSAFNLVALCDVGVWSGLTITPVVFFSHNGGSSWSRQVAPAFGIVSSPSSSTAIIAIAHTLWRTTDGGARWQVVFGSRTTDGSGAIELGFTTPTQGFAILGGDQMNQTNQMVITRDGGATWSPFGP